MMTSLLLIAGFVFLILGAELLVRGASKLAAIMHVSSLIIGLTIVAFGTSAPEFAVSFQAALIDQAGIAVGNVVGSNIFNVLFILGISAIIAPLSVSVKLIRFDVPLMIAASVLVFLFGFDGFLDRLDGILLFSCIIGYLIRMIVQGRREGIAAASASNSTETKMTMGGIAFQITMIVAGLVLLVFGARWLVQASVAVAEKLGVSDLIIGLTIVAAGTSLPELATSVIASIRGERDIAVGNVVGSNIFNIFAVLGLSAAVSPHYILVDPVALRFDIPIMIAVAVACFPVFFTMGSIERWEGFLFMGYYIAYTAYLVLTSSHHRALNGFIFAMETVIIPLTVLTVIVSVFDYIRTEKQNRGGIR